MKTKAIFSVQEIAPLFFAIFIDILSFGLVYPVLTALFTLDSQVVPLGTSDQLRYFYLSLGFLLAPLFMFFGASFMGDLSDFCGRKKVLLICMWGLFLSFALMGVGIKLASIFLVLFGRALSGLMSGSMPVALAAISDLSTRENKALHMSFIALVQSVGFILGPFMGGVLSDKKLFRFFDFAFPFFIAALLALGAAIWIWIVFTETFCEKKGLSLHPKRIFQVFIEAWKNPAIRLLSLSFLLMQSGIALYFQLILIFYSQRFNYSALKMGLFNAYIGVWLAVGILFGVPLATKRFRVEKIALFCLLITALSEFFISLTSSEVGLWLLAIVLAISVQIGFTTMLTSFSNAADSGSQGWAMGLTGSLIAIAFVVTGISPSFVPKVGTKGLIFFGSLLMLGAFFCMRSYCRRFLRQN